MGTGDWDKMLPEPELLEKYFHEQFKILPDHQRKRSEWKKGKAGKNAKNKEKRRAKIESCGDVVTLNGPPEVELPTNASSFAVFASVRLAVLERWLKQACQIYLSSSSSAPPADGGSEVESDSEENTEKGREVQPLRVPKIVGVGLRSVFELIRESRSSHPVLCTKALCALLDVVQGQQPEGLKSEPAEVIDPLFDLLLDLATSHGPESAAANDGSHLTAVACACLLSLVVVRGDTGKLLSATAALLMCPRALASQNIHMPAVLTALQRSVHGVLLGKVVRPDWITHGVPKNSRIDSFRVKMSGEMHSPCILVKALASDGQFLYLDTSKGLLKIGSGYGGTIKGHVYLHKPDFKADDRGWLGYANGVLYSKISSKKSCDLLAIDKETLRVVQVVSLEGKDWGSCVMFSDGESLGMITSAKDDGFVVRMVNPATSPVVSVNELPLKLARKCLDVFGSATFDEEPAIHTLYTGCDEEVAMIAAGKDFGLIRTNSGKILYCGKSSSLGIKQGGMRSGKWAELPVTKSPKVVHFAVGHEGLHAILLAEDGTVFFAGTARRGEDGDQNKARRQPKPTKPKKMIKVDGQNIVHAACNNGTTALVTKEGELLIFGKDTAHCDNSTGHVSDLKDVHVTQVALGKAHAVALTNKGHVYTFGINNKGQCGRDFATQVKEVPMVVAMETTGEEEVEEEELDWEDAQESMCPPGKHKWKHELCMVCTVCRECTGYSISCLSSMRPDRNPGQECGCGEGDSGCAECGCCRICARESVDNSELAILGPSGAGDLAGMVRLDLIFGGEAERRHGARLQDLQRRLDERKQRQRGRLATGSSKHCSLKMKGVSNRAGPSTVAMATSKPVSSLFRPSPPLVPAAANILAEEQAGSSDVERDASRVTSLPPARVHLPVESPVTQIACGLHHTVLLLQSGEVMTFGSNTYGQLGVGDLLPRGGPTLVKLASHITQVAAGSNHTVVLTSKGEIYTFGSFQKGQLGRPSPNTGPESPVPSNSSNRKDSRLARDGPWYTYPGLVPNIGPRHGRRATWVGASGDQTYLKIDESLINSLSLTRSTVMANKTSIILLPTQSDHASSFKCLAINKRDGNCSSFCGNDQVDFSNTATCLDPLYNVLWSYHPGTHEMTCYNVVACETRATASLPPSILSPELALPVVSSCFVTRSQAALHLLSCLDTLTQAQDQRFTVREESEDRQAGCGKVYSREDFSAVTRFESHGGGWGYSGHSIEAIRFMADADILLGGFGLFGGRGEYTGKIKLFDIGVDGGEQETDGEMLAETEEVPYECGPRQKFPMLFEEPIPLQANRWYVAWARVSGPSSDCGSSGQGMVTTEDQVVFYFKSSKKSNNGTDVNAGQIPQLLYRVITPENQSPSRQTDQSEPVYILSREFSRAVSRECFQSLLALLQWSWNTFKAGLIDISHISSSTSGHLAALLDLERLVYISRASLRLLRTYTNEIYPNQVGSKKIPPESVRLAECVGDVRALLRQILSDSVPNAHVSRRTGKTRSMKSSTPYMKMSTSILEECHETFVSCFHAFYPTAFLKWNCLCDLLAITDKGSGEMQSSSDRLLSAVLAALCSPTVRLRSTFPILTSVLDASDSLLKRQLSPSDNTGLPMMPCVDGHHYPILVEQMSYRSQLEGNSVVGNWLFREVLERLLDIVTLPVKQALCQEKTSFSNELVKNCCHLLARVVAELASQSSGTDEDLQGACGRILHTTPSRFTRTNQSRTWNTGNGSPDAICFSVDRPGIVIAGVCVYGGVGTYEYELELLDDQNNTCNDPSHTQRWNSLEMARGTFGPDDCVADVAEVKFDRPISIKENVKYAVRLRNHGGRTSNGDGGLSSVKGPDGTTFTFSTCSLSFNGTTQTRGQIPQILYYSNPQDSESQQTSKAWAELQACKCTLSMTSAISQRCNDLMALARERAEDQIATEVLGNAYIVTTLLPLVLAHISPLATLDPRSGVQVLNMIQELLPHVAALNLLGSGMQHSTGSIESIGGQCQATTNTSSHHYAWVESDHPYKAATVSNYRVSFPECVKWLCIEFDSQCGTAQAEDSLQLYIPSLQTPPARKSTSASSEDDADSYPVPYWPILHKFSRGTMNWPQTAIVLPGNEVIFSLETASDYVKDEKACFYGFRCLVVGYEWHTCPGDGLKHLETELSFLGGMCAASLMKKELLLPPASMEEMDEDMDMVEELAQHVYKNHSTLLHKGFALASAPSITQALEGILPFRGRNTQELHDSDTIDATDMFRSAHEIEDHLELCNGRTHVVICSKPAVHDRITSYFICNLTCSVYWSRHMRQRVRESIPVPPELIDPARTDVDEVDVCISNPWNNCPVQDYDDIPNMSTSNQASICHSNERTFLKDLVHCVPGTSGGRLSRWLQPDSYVDPSRCEVLYSKDDMRCGWPAIVTVVTKDQYGDIVHVPNLKIEVKAVPIDKKEVGDSDQGRKMRRVSQPDALTFGGHAHPSLDTPYEVTVKDKMCYYAITIMKAYENYSFEELRFTSPAVKRSSENMLVRPNSDGTYSATWTPGSVGWYSVLVTIDGYDMQEVYKVEVKEPPQGMTPPTQSVVKKAPHQPSRLRKFVAKNSAGLRIRAHPSLQSEQIGIVHVNGTIAFIDEIHNDDGVWLRLSQDTIHQYCSNGHGEAWCLQYNQHLGKTLLLPVEEPKSILDQVIKETIMRKLPDSTHKEGRPKSSVVCGPGEYTVVKCGASGHNVRSRPSLKAPPVGMLVLGNQVTVMDHVVNGEGTWVQLDKETMRKFCFNNDGEAWSLALSRSDVVYLKKDGVPDGEYTVETRTQALETGFSPQRKGFDFSHNTTPSPFASTEGAGFNFGTSTPQSRETPPPGSAGSSNTNPFVFGSFGQDTRLGTTVKAIHDILHGPDSKPPEKPEITPKPSILPHARERARERERDRESGKFAALQKWLKGEEGRHSSERRGSPGRDLPPELVGVSVKDLVKAIGESRANGNGVTPPGTPRRTSRSSSPKAGPGGGASPRISRSSSPVPIPAALGSRQSCVAGTTHSLVVPPPPAGSAGCRPVVGLIQHESPSSSPQACGSPRSIGLSPLVSGALVDSQHSAGGSHRRGSTQSDTSALVSSLTRDLSQSPSGCTTTANTRDLSPSPSCSSLQMRSEGSPNSTPETPRKNEQDPLGYSPKAVTQTGTQTSPESAATSMKGHFSIGASGNKEERLSPKLSRKDRSGTGSKTRSSKRAMSPAPSQQPVTRDRSLTLTKEPVKEAISPSVAESLRAIFAAFLWHEGVVHDAMACASFLKFHPSLPKQGALVVTRQPAGGSGGAGSDKRKSELTKEQRARQRHSVEVSTAGTYLHIQPSTLETLTRSAANANANRNRAKKQQQQSHAESTIKEEMGAGSGTAIATGEAAGKLSSLPEASFHTVTVLPPALKSLVFLWEELSTNCLQAIMQQVVLPSPTMPIRPAKKLLSVDKIVGGLGGKSMSDGKEPRAGADREPSGSKKAGRKKKEWKPMGRANLFGEVAGGLAGAAAAMLGGGIERETACELCGNMYPHPVTYHMRQAHPGCGGHAGGKGYNSGGNFCVGWAGNCGDGGVGGSSWYLVCDTCREKYLRTKKQLGGGKDKSNSSKKNTLNKKKVSASSVSKILSPTASSSPLETHIIMKNNAMFLLDLASAAGSGFPTHQQRRSSINNMPSVAENYSPPDPPGPFSPAGPFQCLQSLGVHPSQQMPEDQQFLEETYRRQSVQQSLLEAGLNGNSHLSGSLGVRPMSEGPLSDNESEGSKGRTFHRSISMGTNGAPWSRREGDGRIIMMRKRNNSSGEMASGKPLHSETTEDGGSSLLCYPSAALQKLVPCIDQSAIVTEQFKGCSLDILNRPVMSFILQQHNLEALQLAMRQALRKATCRVYAMQALNWLLRSVTQPICLHDLLWWFVAALTPTPPDPETEGEEDNNKTERKEDVDIRGVCEHPLSDISIAGEAVHPLPSTFHTLLQTIADLMLLLPMGSALQQMAIRCWGLRFTQADHMFLHRSQVFSNISKILSRSEEEQDDISISMQESHQSTYSQITSCVETLKDLTPNIEIKASSRQAMVGSLTDSSTETFWESGDEDRNKTKTITIMCAPQAFPRMVFIHIDNCRDLANKVSSVTFQSGPNADELYKLRQVEVENRSTGWVSCPILDARHSVVRLELKGPDNSLRLRQIRVLGEIEGESLKLGKQHSAMTIQQRNCETETLRVFRLITSQVFGKLILGEQAADSEAGDGKAEGEESNDLKEHMVGILFSRSKLTHLQKQVCMHIVQAIRKEATRVREEWESMLCSAQTAPSGGSSSSGHSGEVPKSADTYCFEMLSMVLALSGSSVGRAYLSHQYSLLRDLLSLLHTGSARVQRQVTSLLRRMLPEISPAVLGNVMSVDRLPPADFSIVSAANKAASEAESRFDIHRVGILDVFLSCIAKALTVQVKVKGKDASGGKGLTTVTLATSIHPRDFVGTRWWLRGCISRKLAEVIIQLMKDMAAGKLSEAWANVTKGAVAENILNLTKLDESQRNPSDCLRTPTLWLALASLCVLDSEHVERLSSGQWTGAADGQPPPPRPTCSNHDDGETGAIIQCNVCGNLCADCDRFLHLHRRTRMHQRQVCKEEEEAIKVDLHEGCGRTKLFWVMALADSCTLKAMVEFREGTRSKPAGVTSGVCRFCGATGNSGLLAIGNICADQECQEHARNACNKLHSCGHMCGGIKGESKCLPCLHGCSADPTLKQDADDMCMICFTEALSCAPAIQLKCGHVFHYQCCRCVLMKRWAGPRITFAFAQCPICKSNIEHEVLTDLLAPVKELYEDVRRKALMRLEYEGLHKAEAITSPGARFHNDPASYAMDRYAYYVCYKCNKAYYGGEARCDAEVGEEYDPTELVCGACSDVSRAQMCPKHGTDFLEYKCRYCCSVAVFFCFGTTHFCNACHDDFQRVTNIPRLELPSCPAGPKAKQLEGDECPLHVKHPPTGEEFALGCGVCRNAHTF